MLSAAAGTKPKVGGTTAAAASRSRFNSAIFLGTPNVTSAIRSSEATIPGWYALNLRPRTLGKNDVTAAATRTQSRNRLPW